MKNPKKSEMQEIKKKVKKIEKGNKISEGKKKRIKRQKKRKRNHPNCSHRRPQRLCLCSYRNTASTASPNLISDFPTASFATT